MSEAIDSTRMDGWNDLELSYHTVMPDKWTFQSDKIREWCESYCAGRVLNACAGKTHLNHGGEVVRNDINEDRDADHHHDVCELADHLPAASFDTVVFDPPFSIYQANRNYEGETVGDVTLAKEQFHEILRPGGRVIQFGFTTTCMPMAWDYRREAAAVFNTLGQMNDYLGVVDRRLNADVRSFGGDQ